MVKSALTLESKSTKTAKKATKPKATQSKATKSKATVAKSLKKAAAAEPKREKCPTGTKKSKKGCKPKRDPNKPKRAISAYLFWSQEERPKMKAAHPEYTAPEMLKALAKGWVEAKKGDVSKWERAHEEDKKRAETQMAKYKAGQKAQKELPAEASEAEESND